MWAAEEEDSLAAAVQVDVTGWGAGPGPWGGRAIVLRTRSCHTLGIREEVGISLPPRCCGTGAGVEIQDGGMDGRWLGEEAPLAVWLSGGFLFFGPAQSSTPHVCRAGVVLRWGVLGLRLHWPL